MSADVSKQPIERYCTNPGCPGGDGCTKENVDLRAEIERLRAGSDMLTRKTSKRAREQERKWREREAQQVPHDYVWCNKTDAPCFWPACRAHGCMDGQTSDG